MRPKRKKSAAIYSLIVIEYTMRPLPLFGVEAPMEIPDTTSVCYFYHVDREQLDKIKSFIRETKAKVTRKVKV